jgi:hypothetical protein
MVMLNEWVILFRVVAVDQREPRKRGSVPLGAMKQIAVEEGRVTRLHDDRSALVALKRHRDTFWICADLIVNAHMIQSAQEVGPRDDLNAAGPFICWRDGDETAGHIWA